MNIIIDYGLKSPNKFKIETLSLNDWGYHSEWNKYPFKLRDIFLLIETSSLKESLELIKLDYWGNSKEKVKKHLEYWCLEGIVVKGYWTDYTKPFEIEI